MSFLGWWFRQHPEGKWGNALGDFSLVFLYYIHWKSPHLPSGCWWAFRTTGWIQNKWDAPMYCSQTHYGCGGWSPAMKPTRFLTNFQEVAKLVWQQFGSKGAFFGTGMGANKYAWGARWVQTFRGGLFAPLGRLMRTCLHPSVLFGFSPNVHRFSSDFLFSFDFL